VKDNVILIGFAATGKTCVGRRLAERLSREFVDTDQRVEEMAGKPIPEIIAEEGSEAFEELERQALKEACTRRGVVIAVGGGAIMLDENRDLMVEAGHVVCLEAKPRTIYERLRRAQAEGTSSVADALLKGDDPVQRIAMFKEIRQSYYGIADWTVHTDRLTIDQVVEEVVHGLEYLEDGWAS
jgi:shikimate kinase